MHDARISNCLYFVDAKQLICYLEMYNYNHLDKFKGRKIIFDKFKYSYTFI